MAGQRHLRQVVGGGNSLRLPVAADGLQKAVKLVDQRNSEKH